jgi:hypothetical protein
MGAAQQLLFVDVVKIRIIWYGMEYGLSTMDLHEHENPSFCLLVKC